ncbi:MAG: ATP-binding protein [Oscillospiraceae bacterium]|nr:ATP-binding protein [Oscillospiraceae bacterium]
MQNYQDYHELVAALAEPAFASRGGVVDAANDAAVRLGVNEGERSPAYVSDDTESVALGTEVYAVKSVPLGDALLTVLSSAGDSAPDEGFRRAAAALGASEREPLSVLVMTADYLLPVVESLGEERANSYAALLNKTLHRLRRFSDHIDGIVYPGGDAPRILKSTFDLARAARETAAAADSLLGDITCGVSCETEPESLLFYGDKRSIMKAVYELIGNSVAHGGRRVSVKVALKTDGRRALLSVSDDGLGVAADVLPAVWARYSEQGEPGASAGLGLGYAASVARRHGGSAALDSRPGEGTVVMLALPITEEPRGDVFRDVSIPYAENFDALVELSDTLPAEHYLKKRN